MRENNVQYKMREIVKQIREALLADSGMGPTTAIHARIDQLTQAALDLPLRQCDVGTAEEQSKRYEAYCAEFGRHSDGSPKCIGCPLETRMMKIGGMCELAWAQMPYAEVSETKGDADGSK